MRLKVPGGEIDTSRRVICTGGEEFSLREKEARILEVLAEVAGQVVSREALLEGVFGYTPGSTSRTLVTTIGRTRKVLVKAGLSGDLLQSVYGEGYRWLGPPTTALAAASPSLLVGRHAEAARLRTLVDDSDARLVTLLGPGGIGKSTLARHVAAQQPGAHFVELAGVHTLPGTLHTIGHALGLHGVPDAFSLQHRGVGLLVLDNVEQLLESVRTLAQRWLDRVPHLRIWCTSRRKLGLGREVVVPIGPLTAADGRALFLARSPSATSASPGDLKAVVHALEGHPLSIELAAARCTLYSVDELRIRLESDTERILSGVTECISRSLDLLESTSRDALSQLAAVPVAASRPRLATVLHIDGDPDDTLLELIEHHLVRRVEGPTPTFRLHESVRSAMQTLAAPNAQAPARARWIDSVLEDATRWEDGEDVDTATGELLSAMASLLHDRDVDRIARLMLFAMHRFERGHDPEALGEIIERVTALPARARVTVATVSVARLWLERLRDVESAGTLSDEAVRHARACRDDLLICRALELRAQVLAAAQRREQAGRDFAEATFRHRAAGRRVQAAAVRVMEATASLRWGELVAANQALDSVAGDLSGAPFEHRFRHLQVKIALIIESGLWADLPAATDRLVAMAEAEGTDEHRAWAMVEHAFCLLATQGPQLALSGFQEAAELAGQAWLVVKLWCNVAGTLARDRRWEEAERLMHQTMVTARLAGGRAERLALLRGGWLAQLRGDLPLARSLSGIDPNAVGNIPQFIEHPLMHAQAGDLEKAIEAQRRIVENLNQTGFVYQRRRALLTLGDLYLAHGEFDAAAAVLEPIDADQIQPYERSRLLVIRMAAAGEPGLVPPAFDPLLALDNACWVALAHDRAGNTAQAEDLWDQVRRAMEEDGLPKTSELGWRLAASRARGPG